MLNFISMGDFYKRLETFKASKSLSYGKLGAIIGKSGDAMRMAITRKSLTDLEIEKLENTFAGNEQKGKLSVEDQIAIKVMEVLNPYIKGLDVKLETILEHINKYEVDMDELKDAVEETKQEVIKRS